MTTVDESEAKYWAKEFEDKELDKLADAGNEKKPGLLTTWGNETSPSKGLSESIDDFGTALRNLGPLMEAYLARLDEEAKIEAERHPELHSTPVIVEEPKQTGFSLSAKNNFVLAVGLPAIFFGLLAAICQALKLPEFFLWLIDVGLAYFCLIRPFSALFRKK